MKVLIVGNGSVFKNSGRFYLNKHTRNFCEEMSETHDVGFLQFEENSELDNGVQDSIVSDNIKVHSRQINVNSNFLLKLISYLRLFLLSYATILKYDKVYIFYPGNAPKIISLLCIFLQKDFGLYIRGEGGLYTRIEKFILNKAKFCLCVSQNFVEDISPFCNDVSLIRPMIDFDEDDISTKCTNDLSEDDCITCVFVGRVSTHKGIKVLASAYDLLQKTELKGKVKFNIVGAGELSQEMEQRYLNDGNFILHGVISDKELLKSIYKQSDVFILPSYKEGFPRVIYESMIVGLPIITTMVGGIHTLLEDRKSCLMVGIGNHNDIAEAIKELYDNHQLRRTLADNATLQMEMVFNRESHSQLLKFRL